MFTYNQIQFHLYRGETKKRLTLQLIYPRQGKVLLIRGRERKITTFTT